MKTNHVYDLTELSDKLNDYVGELNSALQSTTWELQRLQRIEAAATDLICRPASDAKARIALAAALKEKA